MIFSLEIIIPFFCGFATAFALFYIFGLVNEPKNQLSKDIQEFQFNRNIDRAASLNKGGIDQNFVISLKDDQTSKTKRRFNKSLKMLKIKIEEFKARNNVSQLQ
ncbi:hypothetical protein MWU78_06855 [Arenibacter sp. F26102]|uniref:hypothetical protein n=1 Tax=Arenibacter sp. F26102 TaxID=2926416 RepID=UPI001FF1DE9B|nr:hypothetical protein [Arenibacter sp. F26102]MCK0145354.1 hypothetical protein [Arenibacter sp. F26102]